MLKRSEQNNLLTLAAMIFALLSLAGMFIVSIFKLTEMGQ